MENSMTEPEINAALPESVQVSDVGARLKAAREAAGKDVLDIAAALKLGARQIAALENGDWSALPGPTFIRGFVRNYARYLGLPVDDLMRELDAVVERSATILSVPESSPSNIPYSSNSSRRRDRHVMVVGLLAVVLAGFIYTLLPDDLDALRGHTQSLLDGFSRKEEPAQPVADTPEPVLPPGTTAQQVLTPQILQPVEPATPPVSPVDSAPVAVQAVADASATQLEFTVEKTSWVEVKDRDGLMVFSQRLPAGAKQSVSGKGPLNLVIGYAPGVKLVWRGQPINLEPHTRGDVARLVLE